MLSSEYAFILALQEHHLHIAVTRIPIVVEQLTVQNTSIERFADHYYRVETNLKRSHIGTAIKTDNSRWISIIKTIQVFCLKTNTQIDIKIPELFIYEKHVYQKSQKNTWEYIGPVTADQTFREMTQRLHIMLIRSVQTLYH